MSLTMSSNHFEVTAVSREVRRQKRASVYPTKESSVPLTLNPLLVDRYFQSLFKGCTSHLLAKLPSQ